MRNMQHGTKKNFLNWGAIVLFVTVLAVFPLVLSGGWLSAVTEMLIMALCGLSLNLIVGYGGMVSFGHAGLYAAGAYGFALLEVRLGASFPVAMITGPLVAAVIGCIVGWFCVRLTANYFALLTMAFGMIIWSVINSWYDFTNGDNGIYGIPKPEILNTLSGYYYFTLIVVAACVLLLKMILSSPYGVVLRATRENTNRVNFLGVNVRRYQWFTFTLSSFFMGVGGVLFAGFNSSVFPQFSYWTKSGEFLIVVLLGGMYNFIGPIVGGIVFVYLDKVITSYTVYWPLILGIILMSCTILFRSGIVGFISEKVMKPGR